MAKSYQKTGTHKFADGGRVPYKPEVTRMTITSDRSNLPSLPVKVKEGQTAVLPSPKLNPNPIAVGTPVRMQKAAPTEDTTSTPTMGDPGSTAEQMMRAKQERERSRTLGMSKGGMAKRC